MHNKNSKFKIQNSKLQVCLLTDVFPPGSGGSGWSTYYLGKALAEKGHSVRVLRPRYHGGVARPGKRVVEYGGLKVEEALVPDAPSWAVRLGLGKAWEERVAIQLLTGRALYAAKRGEADILHGQHKVSVIAASRAARWARRAGARVAAAGTVRDYWPLCPVSARLFTDAANATFECDKCHLLMAYLRCAGAGKGVLRAYPAAFLRWANTWNSARELGRCHAIIAVSDYVRGQLEVSGRVPENKLVTIPNMVDLPSVDRALRGEWPLPDIQQGNPFLLFAGKFDPNKGAQMLPEAVARSGVKLPVVLVGDGPLQDKIAVEAAARGLDFRFYSWLDNDAVIRLMHNATALLFPSAWQEPLSRVLLEGCAAGAAIVALDTGGTGDVVVHGTSGWLAPDIESFPEGIRQVVADAALNGRLREGARRRAEEKFAAPYVSARVENLYRHLLTT